MKTRIVAILSLAGLVVIGSLAYAQPRGRGTGMPMYDKTTEITVKGAVEAVGRTHLTFKAADNTEYDVHLGPTGWLTANNVEFAKGDQLEIVGSSITFKGRKALIAREISRGDQKTTLRDANGVPVWSGRGRRTQS